MSVIRLYVDEDASEHAVRHRLRARGIDVLTAFEANLIGATDYEQLVVAVELERLMYTFNVSEFARLHLDWLHQGRDHCGIVVIPDQRYSIDGKYAASRGSQPYCPPKKWRTEWSTYEPVRGKGMGPRMDTDQHG